MDIKLGLLRIENTDEYWEGGFKNPDKDMFYYTGTSHYPTKEEIKLFVEKSSRNDERRHFLIWSKENNILGEVVLMDIDDEYRSCGFRIAIFNKENFNKGIGYKATREVLKIAFIEMNLHRVELEVFDYNNRAKAMYEKAGFKEEGVKRDALYINNQFHNVYIMSILRNEFMEGNNEV